MMLKPRQNLYSRVPAATLVLVLQSQSLPPFSEYKQTLDGLKTWSTTGPTDGQGPAIPDESFR